MWRSVLARRAPGARRRVGVRIVPVAAALVLPLLLAPLLAARWLPWTLPLLFLVVPAAGLAFAPLWRWCGAHRYLSPLLFVVRRGEVWELHGGTLLDDLEHFGWRGGRRWRLRAYLQGVRAVIAEIDVGRIPPGARIVATTHLFSERTARRLGFALRPPGPGERVHMVLDVLTLAVLYSRARGRLAIPPVWRVRTGVTTAAALAARRGVVERMLERIEARPP